MKKIFYFTLLLVSVLALCGCSNNDENSNSSLSEIEQKLVGKWNTSSNLTGNTYDYKADKTAVYINTWNNGTQTQVTTYKGAWDVINGDILIEYYPDDNEAWDNNWKQHPTLKNKFVLKDNTLKLTDFYDNSNIITHYRENE